jgi:hypothetical protein
MEKYQETVENYDTSETPENCSPFIRFHQFLKGIFIVLLLELAVARDTHSPSVDPDQYDEQKSRNW